MEIHPELRKGKVVYDGQMYNAKVNMGLIKLISVWKNAG